MSRRLQVTLLRSAWWGSQSWLPPLFEAAQWPAPAQKPAAAKIGYPTLVLMLFFGLLTGCRQDMHDQPRYKPLAATDFFGDRRSARPEIEGTVARGHLHIDSARYTGLINGQEVDVFPFPITKEDLERGQQRFNIYCSPCHSRVGDGNGMVVRRGFQKAADYHTEKLINAPVGHFFNVITNGYGAMPSYAARVENDDRWRIAAYIRVLQLSQNAKISDVPEDKRAALEAAQ